MRLFEIANKQALFYWQQRAIEVLPDSFDVELQDDKLVFKFNGKELIKLKPPNKEAGDWDELGALESRFYWSDVIDKLLPERYSIKVIAVDSKSSGIAVDKELSISVLQNSKELFLISPPRVINPNPFNMNFWISGDFIQGNYLINVEGFSRLEKPFLSLLKAFDLRRKLSNLLSKKVFVVRDDTYFGPKLMVEPPDSFTPSIVVKMKPDSPYEVVYLSRPQIVIGSAKDEMKAFDLVEKAIAKRWP